MNSLVMEGASVALPFRIMGALKKAFPALDHAFLKHSILDGDTYMLHKAERELLKTGNNWKENFFMPAQDDLPIVTFRRWLEDHGGSVPTLEETPPALSKRESLDRHHQHTRHCSHCQKVDGMRVSLPR